MDVRLKSDTWVRSQPSRKSSYKFARPSDSFIRILFAAFQHICTDFVDVRANRYGAIGLQPALTQERINWHSLSKGSPPPSTRSQQKTQAIRHAIHRLPVSFAGRRPEGREVQGRTGRVERMGGRTEDERETETDWRSLTRTQKRCGPAHTHRPTAV